MIARDAEHDPALGTLSMLTMHEPDAARAARTLARGRALLAVQANRRTVLTRLSPSHRCRVALEPVFVAGACAVFLLEVLSRAARLYGF